MRNNCNGAYRNLIISSLVAGIVVNVLRAIFSHSPIISFLSVVYYLTVPGSLILYIINKFKNTSVIKGLVLTVSLSVTFLMFGSFLCNQLLSVQGAHRPLDSASLVIWMNALLAVLAILAYFRAKNSRFNIQSIIFGIGRADILILIGLIIIPLQVFIGAQILNNGGSSITSIITAIEIIVLLPIIVFLRKRLKLNLIIPLALLSISIAVLLMLSLRSRYVLGWDINQELYTALLAQTNGKWVFALYREPYNACLSITTMPIALSVLTGLKITTLFKIVYPIIFAFSSMAIYKLFSQYTTKILAFLAVIIIIAQPQYISEISMLARQEIALLFVSAAYLVLFSLENKPNVSDKIIFILLSFSLIASHYSTAYIFIISISLMYLWVKILPLLGKRISSISIKNITKNNLLSVRMISTCLLFALLWNVQFTTSSSNLGNFSLQVARSMGQIFSGDLRSESTNSAIWHENKVDQSRLLRDHINKINTKSENTLTTSYNPTIIYPRTISTSLGSNLYKINLIYPILSTLLKLCMVVGILILFYKRKYDNKNVMLQGAVIAYTIGLGLFVVMPYISLAYNFERFTLQALFVLGLPIIWGLNYFSTMFRKIACAPIVFMVSIITIYWVFTFGIAAELLGGTAPVQFNNYGLLYSRFYMHGSEVSALSWLQENTARNSLVYADLYTSIRQLPYAKLQSNQVGKELIPPFAVNSYVFSSSNNTINGMAFALIDNKEITYTYPTQYLNMNKNSIYNSGSSIIYR